MREPECPSCRKSATEAQFRVNPALEEVVSAWKAARYAVDHISPMTCSPMSSLRSNVLRLSREERSKANSRHNSSIDKTPRRYRTPAQNGRKRRHAEVSESSDSDVVCVAGPSNADESSEIAGSSPLQGKGARKASRRRTGIEPLSDPGEEELQRKCVCASPLPCLITADFYLADTVIECPVCSALVEFQVINSHMDGPDCGQGPPAEANNSSNSDVKTEWLKVFGGDKSKKGKNKDNR